MREYKNKNNEVYERRPLLASVPINKLTIDCCRSRPHLASANTMGQIIIDNYRSVTADRPQTQGPQNLGPHFTHRSSLMAQLLVCSLVSIGPQVCF